MTIFYVDGNAGNDSNDGSSNKPWKTLNKATDRVSPGDEVRIRTATYEEVLRLRTANTTWRADTGHKPVIDGRYHDGLFNAQEKLPHPDETTNFLPEGDAGSMVGLGADGVTLDGLTIQNLAGSAVSVSASNCTVRNCRIDFVYNSAIKANTTSGAYMQNVVFENNVCTRISVRYYDPLRGGGGEAVGGVLKMGRTRDGIIRNNVCAYGHGEGINVGKDNYRVLVEGNIVHTCNHVHLYINRSVDVTMRNNLVYHLYIPVFVGDNGKPPAGIAIGDEKPDSGQWIHTSGGQIYNNIVIGLGALFGLRNNVHNYNTVMENCYVGYNTFIAGSKTWVGVNMAGNLQGRTHRNSVFENNLIYSNSSISQASGDISGIAFRNNLWSTQPQAAMRGPGDRIGDPNLTNVAAELRHNFPDPESNIDLRNYRLTERSTLAIGRASDGSRINNLQPPEIRKDFFGSNRDGQPDIGAHEYDGVAVAITANFSVGGNQASGVAPLTVDFIDQSTSDRPIVAHEWEFGDGGTSTETNPHHTYEAEGTYDVTLTVTDDQGNSDSKTREEFITVTAMSIDLQLSLFRRFALLQTGVQEVIAYGTQFPDLSCVMFWQQEPSHILNFDSIEDAQGMVLQTEGRELVWIDSGDEADPLLTSDEEPESLLALEMGAF